MRKYWTAEEDAKLAEFAPTHTMPEIVKEFGRTRDALEQRMRNNGIKWIDGRKTSEFSEKLSKIRSEAEAVKFRTKQEYGATKSCQGHLHKGSQIPTENFSWGKTGWSLRSRCKDCLKEGNREYARAKRAAERDPSKPYFTRLHLDCNETGHTCSSCKVWQKAENFAIESRPRKGNNCIRLAQCLVCVGVKKYNLTANEFNWLLNKQENKCRWCKGTNKSGARLGVEHNHECCGEGKACVNCIRSLACHRCNRTIGDIESSHFVDLMKNSEFASILLERPFLSDEYVKWKSEQGS